MTDAPKYIWATPMDSEACLSGTFIPADGDRPNADARHYTRSDIARAPVAVKPLIWTDPDPEFGHIFSGLYEISSEGNLYIYGNMGDVDKPCIECVCFDSVEDAKAHSNTLNETRIREALA